MSVLEDFKFQKLKFITKVQLTPEPQHQIYAQVTEMPIVIVDDVNYFFVTLYWSGDLHPQAITKSEINGTRISQKLKSNSYFDMPKQKNQQETQMSVYQSQQVLLSFIYVISQKMYVSELLSKKIVQVVNRHVSFYLFQNNQIFIAKISKFKGYKDQMGGGRQSTAADTKYINQRRSQVSDLSSIYVQELRVSQKFGENNSSFFNRKYSPLLQTPQIKNHYNKGKQETYIYKKVFSKVFYTQKSNLESLIKITQNIEKQCQQQGFFFIYRTLQLITQRINTKVKKIKMQKVFQENTKLLMEQNIQTCIKNYRTSLKLQYVQIECKPIEVIKELLSRLYDAAIDTFFQLLPYFIQEKVQKFYHNKLLQKINTEQNQILNSIGQIKSQVIERKIILYQDQDNLYNMNRVNTIFENLIGERHIDNLQVGYSQYRQGIQKKMGKIFQQLFDEDKEKLSKPNNWKLTTRKDFNKNIQNRIQILMSQKRSIEQGLLFQERLQQNLVQYYKGVQEKGTLKKDIQTISESQED